MSNLHEVRSENYTHNLLIRIVHLNYECSNDYTKLEKSGHFMTDMQFHLFYLLKYAVCVHMVSCKITTHFGHLFP